MFNLEQTRKRIIFFLSKRRYHVADCFKLCIGIAQYNKHLYVLAAVYCYRYDREREKLESITIPKH